MTVNTQKPEGQIMVEKDTALDATLSDLRDAVTPIIDTIDADIDTPRAVMMIGAIELPSADGEDGTIQTVVDICGNYDVLGEAMYNELMNGIESNTPQLFQLLRQVVRTIEQDLGLEPDAPYDFTERILH